MSDSPSKTLAERVAALREVVGRMTPGKWQHLLPQIPNLIYGPNAQKPPIVETWMKANAAGIVALRNEAMPLLEELSAEVERLRACERIGQLLANLAYNWKHGPNRWLSDDDRAMLAALQKQWDAAIAREAKP